MRVMSGVPFRGRGLRASVVRWAPLVAVGLLLVPGEARAAATVATVRVSVFKQGTSFNRAVGSLVGVWHWTGRTMDNQHENEWMRPFKEASTNFDGIGAAVDRLNPAIVFGSTERQLARFTGTTWDTVSVSTNDANLNHTVAIYNSSFALVGTDRRELWRWTGTSWIHDLVGVNDSAQPKILTINIFGTNEAYAFANGLDTTIASDLVWHWTGTSWLPKLQQTADFTGGGVMIDTSYGWYAATPDAGGAGNMYRWTGTSWIVHSQVPPGFSGQIVYTAMAVPYERDFAVIAGQNAFLLRWTGTTWLHEGGITGGNYLNSYAVATNHAWLCSNQGDIVLWTGTSWVRQGPLQSGALNQIDAPRTDYAVAVGDGGHVWFWRGTSWVRDTTLESSQDFRAVATAGETISFVAGEKAVMFYKQRLNILDDASGSGADWSGTLYRTVVQVMPEDDDWQWNGESSATDSYIGVRNRGGNSYEFLDEGDSVASGRLIVLERDAVTDTAQEDILIWEDTIGWWDGFSSRHNRDATAGVGLTEAGIVHNDFGGALPADVWGETDSRITSAERSTSQNTWEEGTGGDVTVQQNVGTLTLEFWHYFSGGFAEGEEIETALHMEKGVGPDSDLAGVSWAYRVGNYRPRIGTWRWCSDTGASPTPLAAPRVALTDVGTKGEALRLRMRVDETDGGWQGTDASSESPGWSLWYSTDQKAWTQVTAASSVWKWDDQESTAGATIPFAILPQVDTLGISIEDDTSATFTQRPFTEVEMEFAIESNGAATGTTYYFQARHNDHQVLPKPGIRYPSVTTTTDATFNYLVTTPVFGRYSRPLPNPAIIAGGNGDPFKVVYVGTQGGPSNVNLVAAVSRTDGSVRGNAFALVGSLEHPTLYWDSTNSRYNLYFVLNGNSLYALTDDGTTIAENTDWSGSPTVLDFTNKIGRPVRVFDSDKQNYLFVLVSSFQGNTNTLYKIRAADGSVVTGGNYSKGIQEIGFARGLDVGRDLYPLWVEGTAYAIASNNSPDAVVKIPSSGGVTEGYLGTQFLTISQFSPVYTRYTFSTGGRILQSYDGFGDGVTLFTTKEGVGRLNDADLEGVDWNVNRPGSSEDVGAASGTTITTPPAPIVMQFSHPVPVFVGDSDGQVNRLSGSAGTNEANFPYNLTGDISTEIIPDTLGNWIYFGTDAGYIYVLSGTDPSQGAGTRFRVPGDPQVVGVAVDFTNGFVYYTTSDGRLYQFDTR